MSLASTARGRRTLALSPRVLVAGLLAAVATGSGIALTTSSGWLIVRASERPQILTLLTVIVAVRTFGVARPVFRYWERLRSHDAALGDLAARRSATYGALVPLTPARLGKRGRADLLTGVVDDLTDVTEASVRVTVPVIGALLSGLLAAVLTTLLDAASGLVLTAMLLAAALLVLLCWRVESSTQDALLEARAEVGRVSQLTADHAGELQAIGARGVALDWVADAHAALRTALARQSHGRSLVAGGVLVLTGVATAATAVLAARSGHPLPVKGLLVLTPVATGEAIGVLTDATRALARAQGSRRRLVRLLDQEPAVREPDMSPSPTPAARSGRGVPASMDDRAHLDPVLGRPPRIDLEGVTAGWVPGRTDTGPVTLTVAPGDRLAVVGPNGSGKSTLLAVLARHLDPSGGHYLVDGVDVTTLPLEVVRSLVALVDDEPHVFASSLRENLRLAEPSAADEDLERALRAAGLGRWLDGLEHGLDTRLGAGGLGISGGERSRLAIARALVSRRPVILLDEPVAHLDNPTAEAVLEDLLTTAHDRTIVMVTHHGTGLQHFGRTLDLTMTKAG